MRSVYLAETSSNLSCSSVSLGTRRPSSAVSSSPRGNKIFNNGGTLYDKE